MFRLKTSAFLYLDIFGGLVDNSKKTVLFGIGDLIQDDLVLHSLNLRDKDFSLSVVSNTVRVTKSLKL